MSFNVFPSAKMANTNPITLYRSILKVNSSGSSTFVQFVCFISPSLKIFASCFLLKNNLTIKLYNNEEKYKSLFQVMAEDARILQ